MKKVYLLDCTLRDGGYVNNWMFGRETIVGFGKKIAMTGIEMYEVGFLKGAEYDPDRSVFPDIRSFSEVISPKSSRLMYIGMLDMSAPVPLESIPPYDGTSIDGIRVIFKKSKTDEAFVYCKRIKELGYKLFVNFVGTDQYTDEEFITGIRKFNEIDPFAMAIVDSFGLIKRKQFLRMVYIADNNMADGIVLCYHAHNNLQQALGNAEAFVEMNLKRDICVDACVFGMGRGAGNLNLELFAEYMNDNYDTNYRIEPMLEIMDEYLNDIYKEKFWGYSLPLYLSASTGCHPNYAIYFAEKNSLTVKSYDELLSGISAEDKAIFSKETAEKYYRQYMENFIDDKKALSELTEELKGRRVLLLAPGKSLSEYRETVSENAENNIVIAVNFNGGSFKTDYIFSSNNRRFSKIKNIHSCKTITTSNIKGSESDYVVNFASYASKFPDIVDNSGVMLLKLLMNTGTEEVLIAGMDGYSAAQSSDYYDSKLDYDFTHEAQNRNKLISAELSEISRKMNIRFLTPTRYNFSDERSGDIL